MGEVWAAHDDDLERPVAVKVVLADLDTDPTVVARLRREARTAATLQHPGITVVHDIGEHDGRPYFVMELLDGRNFAALLAEHPGGLPVDLAVRLMAEVAEALGYAHDRGVVHRDMKPANLMYLAGGGVKICDFGIARYAEASTHLTATGLLVGTPIFMAPEQWLGEPASAATDLYAFGVTLHMLLAGTPPFPGRSGAELMYQHLNAPPPRLRDRRGDVLAGLDDLLQRLLAKSPANRPTTAQAKEALRAILGWSSDTRKIPDLPPATSATVTVGPWARMSASVSIGAITAGLFGLALGVLLGVTGNGNLLVGGSGDGSPEVIFLTAWIGVLGGGFLGFPVGFLAKPDIITMDGERISVKRAESGDGFSVRWEALERLSMEDVNGKPALLGWFRPSRMPEPKWVAKHRVELRAGGGYVLYPAGRKITTVKPDRLRKALAQHAGHVYDDPDDVTDP